MAAQTLDQVLASLSSVYDPQVQSIQAQQAQLPQQQQSDEAALKAQETSSYNDILNGARSRGTGVAFGGIPLQEQAQYNATNYLPALANLKSSYATKGSALQDALNQINENRTNNAQQIYQFGQQQDLAERQFQYQQAKDAADRAAAARAAAAAFSPTLGYSGASTGTASAPAAPAAKADPYAAINKQNAQTAITQLLNTKNTALINQTYNAIKSSAAHGNIYDQYKMQLFDSILNPPKNTTSANSGSPYLQLLKNAINYKAPTKVNNSITNLGGSTSGLARLGL
jgi:hypothetical protein